MWNWSIGPHFVWLLMLSLWIISFIYGYHLYSTKMKWIWDLALFIGWIGFKTMFIMIQFQLHVWIHRQFWVAIYLFLFIDDCYWVNWISLMNNKLDVSKFFIQFYIWYKHNLENVLKEYAPTKYVNHKLSSFTSKCSFFIYHAESQVSRSGVDPV